MDSVRPQESLSNLVNIDALLGKFHQAKSSDYEARPTRAISIQPVQIKWPDGAVLPSLKGKLNHMGALPQTTAVPDSTTDFTVLNKVLEVLCKDVTAARDRLLLLNPGRRKMVEHRLEFIARKLARSRGERLNRTLSLPDILKESYRESVPGQPGQLKLGAASWKNFVFEVALYQVLELFFLKALEQHGLRPFEKEDLGRMNFAAHNFLSQRAVSFAHDKHCWNFVRTNLYSWYVPSQRAIEEVTQILYGESSPQTVPTPSWSDSTLVRWMDSLPASLRPSHCEFNGELRSAKTVLDLIENQLGQPLVSKFQGRVACKKFFLPSLEFGGIALTILDRLLAQIQSLDEASQLHRAVWACESESLEVFWTEVLTLLKLLRNCDRLLVDATDTQRLPQAMHIVQLLGLELHNLEQLPLGSHDVSKLHQGSAGQIQQIETFDVAIVTDHADRLKSSRWMKALAEQLPYWRSLVSTSSNLNWGELHLWLAASKLKESGYCIYLSHRVLPEGGDGDRLRKTLLGLMRLEHFVELPEDPEAHENGLAYRYLYIFRRESDKVRRDQHHPRFGTAKSSAFQLSELEEASSSQAEIAERGWDHLFVRGAAPLIRHLNHKFPKLFQMATVHSSSAGAGTAIPPLFNSANNGAKIMALEAKTESLGALKFVPLVGVPGPDRTLVFPHNPTDLHWIECLLNSAPVQFWIRHQKQPKLLELRSCPIVDLSHSASDLVHEALAWLGETRRDAAALRVWARDPKQSIPDRHAKFFALSKRFAEFERIVAKYRPLFASENFEELKAEAVTQFYPGALLCHLSQSPDIRIQYADRTRSSLLPEHWTISDVLSVVQHNGGKPMAYVVVETRQGPKIQLVAPASVRNYLSTQLSTLRDHTWGEALSLLRMPRDVALFSAQVTEITRVVCDTASEMTLYQSVLEELALDLFEISAELRQFLPH